MGVTRILPERQGYRECVEYIESTVMEGLGGALVPLLDLVVGAVLPRQEHITLERISWCRPPDYSDLGV